MIDYIKIELPKEVGKDLLESPLLNFVGEHDQSTWEINEKSPVVAYYGPPIEYVDKKPDSFTKRALSFEIYHSGRTILHGSWHKFDQGGSNYGQYHYPRFVTSMLNVCHRFNLDPCRARVLQIEVGANITPPIPSEALLEHFVRHREGVAFSRMRTRSGPQAGIEFERKQQYRYKVYRKGYQYRLQEDILRWEIKFFSDPLRRLGITNLNDLLNPSTANNLRDRALSIYYDTFITEPSINVNLLSNSQKTFILLSTVPAFWKNKTKESRYKAQCRYARIVERYAKVDLKAQLGQILESKFANLMRKPDIPDTW